MRYMTNEERSRRAAFKPTRRAVVSWPIFRVARSLRTTSRYARRSRLEIGELTDGGIPLTYETMHWRPVREIACLWSRSKCAIGKLTQAGLAIRRNGPPQRT